MNKELQEILKLEGFKILKIDERKEKNKIIKVIYVESNNKKQECPNCGTYTSSIHDKLKPIELKYLKELLEQRKPKKLETATLLNKQARRIVEVDVEYIGFEIEDKFVLGYGLDYDQNYRNLPYVGYIE